MAIAGLTRRITTNTNIRRLSAIAEREHQFGGPGLTDNTTASANTDLAITLARQAGTVGGTQIETIKATSAIGPCVAAGTIYDIAAAAFLV